VAFCARRIGMLGVNGKSQRAPSQLTSICGAEKINKELERFVVANPSVKNNVMGVALDVTSRKSFKDVRSNSHQPCGSRNFVPHCGDNWLTVNAGCCDRRKSMGPH